MPHIHTEPNQVDFCVDVYIVYEDKVLLRYHDKHHQWLVPGGHIELNETPEQAAIREVKEEVGLDIKLWNRNLPLIKVEGFSGPNYQELIPPFLMNIHDVGPNHRHISMTYFAYSKTDVIIEPDNHEKSGGCRWMTYEELENDLSVNDATKLYGLIALEQLALRSTWHGH